MTRFREQRRDLIILFIPNFRIAQDKRKSVLIKCVFVLLTKNTSSPAVRDEMELDLLNERVLLTSFPPPQQIPSRAGTGQIHLGKFLVEEKFPYTILAASQKLRDSLGYTKEQLCDRSINILCGPATDKISLVSAIKCACNSAEGDFGEAPSIEIYGRSGVPLKVRIICSKSDDGIAVSCDSRSQNEDAGRSFKVQDRKKERILLGSRRGEPPSVRSEYRARYNFLTGLEIHRAMQREAALSPCTSTTT